MDQLKETYGGIDAKTVIPMLLGKGYAFAYWRMPNTDQRNLVISLSEPKTEKSINELDSGFLFNRFDDNHPKAPIHIKADVAFSGDKDPLIDPRINDAQISEFKELLESNIPRAEAPDSLDPVSGQQSEFQELVANAVREIRNGTFEKVVLSRFQDMAVPEGFSPLDFFDKICDAYPNAFCSFTHIEGEGVWIGASPELLISNDEIRFKTAALAGTRKLEDLPLSELAWTQKEIEEQAFVSRYVINCFKKIRLREFDEHGPKTIQAGNLAHLRTEFDVNYSEVQFDGLADQMLDLLHPTSAVCGMPLEPAKTFIEENERYDRSYYAGFLGPVNFEGSTDLFVNLRCMNLRGKLGRFYAGAGITEDSNPEREKAETDLKMQTLMRIFNG